MPWWAYVQRHSRRSTNVAIAAAVGFTASSVGRWKVSTPDPAHTAAFARSYGRPVLEAFVAAGYLTPEEAGEAPTTAPSLGAFTDSELLSEGSYPEQRTHDRTPPGARRPHSHHAPCSCPEPLAVASQHEGPGGPRRSVAGTRGLPIGLTPAHPRLSSAAAPRSPQAGARQGPPVRLPTLRAVGSSSCVRHREPGAM